MGAQPTEQEASEIRPSPGLDGDAAQGGSGGSASPRGGDASDSQHQQHSGSGHGTARGDGSRSRGGSAATAAGFPAAGGGGGGREGGAPGEGLLPSMDVFSLGCVIAEVGFGGVGPDHRVRNTVAGRGRGGGGRVLHMSTIFIYSLGQSAYTALGWEEAGRRVRNNREG